MFCVFSVCPCCGGIPAFHKPNTEHLQFYSNGHLSNDVIHMEPGHPHTG